MATISQIIDEKRMRIADLERDLELQKAVLAELQRVSLNGESGQKTHEIKARIARPGTIASHINAVLTDHGGAMQSAEIINAVVDRGATTSAEAGLGPSVAAALSRGVQTGEYERVRTGVYRLNKNDQ